METQDMTLNVAGLEAALIFTPKKDKAGRHYLESVLIEVKDGDVFSVGTCGGALLCHQHARGQDQLAPGQWLLERHTVELAVKGAKHRRDSEITLQVRKAPAATATDCELGGVRGVTAGLRYPDWRRVLQGANKITGEQPQLAAGLLAKAEKARKALGSAAYVQLGRGLKDSAVILFVGAPDTFGVVMPMYVQQDAEARTMEGAAAFARVVGSVPTYVEADGGPAVAAGGA